tara:strand:- start:2309 stop:2521 length:213 start_codon:yes stop_codon:yes gene_type:complete
MSYVGEFYVSKEDTVRAMIVDHIGVSVVDIYSSVLHILDIDGEYTVEDEEDFVKLCINKGDFSFETKVKE